MALDIIRASALARTPHAFLGRVGGVSEGIYASLNVGLGTADDPRAVQENRRRALTAVPEADALVTVRQVHGRETAIVAFPHADDARPEADAIVTLTPGLAIGVLTADCAPVLLSDPYARIIGAAHAGWKGALGGIIESVVAAMEEFGAERHRIAAAIGPTIAMPSYEVGEDFIGRVPAAFLMPGRPGHLLFDLEGLVAHRLRAEGIGTVQRLGLDTYADRHRFFSYRRATHANEPDYGRQLSLIALPPR